MSPEFIAQARAEEADLKRKLEAVQSVLAVYGHAISTKENRAPRRAVDAAAEAILPQESREKMPLERFSAYGQQVIKAAIVAIRKRNGAPYPTRELVEAIEMFGPEIRGTNKANALSALLGRSADVMSHGRQGWTLSGSGNKLRAVLTELREAVNEPSIFDEEEVI